MKKYLFSARGLVLVLMQQMSLFNGHTQVSTPNVITAQKKQNIDYIDPTIGNVGHLLEPTRPTAHLPNQPVRVYPIRKDYLDDEITCFPLTAVSHRLGEVFALRPVTGAPHPEVWMKRMPYDHDLEVTHPWYYSTYLLNDGITVEFTPGRLTGFYRFTFPSKATPSILLDMLNDGESSWRFLSGSQLAGMETWQGGVKVYMYGVFSRPGTTGTLDSGRRK